MSMAEKSVDPRELIARSPMTALQIMVVVITIALNALDGFDVLSISFASPGIANEWGIDRAALGLVLSMELIGMAVGSILLGGLADKIGRRPTVLGCLVVMAIGMFMVTTSTAVLGSALYAVLSVFMTPADHRLLDLSIWRVITGLGIGGMLAAINAVAAEFSNAQRKSLNISLMAIGYPLGASIGGFAVSANLSLENWRTVFYFGATVTALLIPVVFFLMPESVHWLARKQPAGALDRINRTLAKMGHAAIAALPVISEEQRKRSVGDIFAPALLRTTLVVTAAYFLHITTFYYIIKWVPKILVDMGFAASAAGNVLSWLNVGGATGGALVGLLSLRIGIKGLALTVLGLSTVAIIAFGNTPADLTRLTMICVFVGFCTNGAINALYAIFAHVFPTHVRAFGTGFAVGVGRGGAVLAPILAGFLFDGGLSLPMVSLIMSVGSAIAAILLASQLKPVRPTAEESSH
jgi:MFS family permease